MRSERSLARVSEKREVKPRVQKKSTSSPLFQAAFRGPAFVSLSVAFEYLTCSGRWWRRREPRARAGERERAEKDERREGVATTFFPFFFLQSPPLVCSFFLFLASSLRCFRSKQTTVQAQEGFILMSAGAGESKRGATGWRRERAREGERERKRESAGETMAFRREREAAAAAASQLCLSRSLVRRALFFALRTCGGERSVSNGKRKRCLQGREREEAKPKRTKVFFPSAICGGFFFRPRPRSPFFLQLGVTPSGHSSLPNLPTPKPAAPAVPPRPRPPAAPSRSRSTACGAWAADCCYCFLLPLLRCCYYQTAPPPPKRSRALAARRRSSRARKAPGQRPRPR
jgi:hypothetical protein